MNSKSFAIILKHIAPVLNMYNSLGCAINLINSEIFSFFIGTFCSLPALLRVCECTSSKVLKELSKLLCKYNFQQCHRNLLSMSISLSLILFLCAFYTLQEFLSSHCQQEVLESCCDCFKKVFFFGIAIYRLFEVC